MDNLFNSKMINANDLFGEYYLNEKALYLHCFNALPNNYFIGQIDGEKAFGAFREKFGHLIKQIYSYRWHDKTKKCGQFSDTLVILDNACLIKFDTTVCDIWHNGQQPEFIDQVVSLISPLRERQRRQPREVNLVIRGNHRLELKGMEIKRIRLNLDLFYGEEFKAVDELIRKRLSAKKDKGIVLLHGLPGSGKTTYLRYLIGKIRKRVLFISPSVAGDLMNPHFIELLTNNPGSVVIIEDAENVIMDRKHSPGSSVSNLLNISDGLLADFLNVQLICTFNNSLTLIDSALLRKGRLIAKHEFGKLSVKQSQRLSDHLGFDTVISRPMTIAEISNQHEQTVEPGRMEVIGFRKHTPLVE
jgi:ATPase family protein associated with various cellular activities (AAA)